MGNALRYFSAYVVRNASLCSLRKKCAICTLSACGNAASLSSSTAIVSHSTTVSSGIFSSYGCALAPPNDTRSICACEVSKRASIDDPASSASNSPICHCRASIHSGSRISARDRKSTRLNSSHLVISYAVFCLKKKKKKKFLFFYNKKKKKMIIIHHTYNNI